MTARQRRPRTPALWLERGENIAAARREFIEGEKEGSAGVIRKRKN